MYIKVVVHPGAKKDRIVFEKPNSLEVWVREKPERNAVNCHLREIVSIQYALSGGLVRLINGYNSRFKLLSVEPR
jgi:uncharacterized protein YggU (UPF0235/DUF167 family)